MANQYYVTVLSVASDGTNLFFEISVSSGATTLPTLRPVFPVGTPVADINSYLQTIANNQPTLSSDIAALVGAKTLGA